MVRAPVQVTEHQLVAAMPCTSLGQCSTNPRGTSDYGYLASAQLQDWRCSAARLRTGSFRSDRLRVNRASRVGVKGPTWTSVLVSLWKVRNRVRMEGARLGHRGSLCDWGSSSLVDTGLCLGSVALPGHRHAHSVMILVLASMVGGHACSRAPLRAGALEPCRSSAISSRPASQCLPGKHRPCQALEERLTNMGECSHMARVCSLPRSPQRPSLCLLPALVCEWYAALTQGIAHFVAELVEGKVNAYPNAEMNSWRRASQPRRFRERAVGLRRPSRPALDPRARSRLLGQHPPGLAALCNRSCNQQGNQDVHV